MRPDDFKVGMFATVSGFKDPNHGDRYWTGKPFEVMAISLPWIAVFDGVSHSSIDTRKYELTRVNREYVEALWRQPVGESYEKVYKRTGHRPEEPEYRMCPRCHDTNIGLLLVGPGRWETVCRTCGLELEDIDDD